MYRTSAKWLSIVVLVALGMLASLGGLLESGVDGNALEAAPRVIRVTSGADRGPGTLRSALFTAMRLPHFVTIRIEVPTVSIEVPLPPVVVSHGAKIVGTLPDPGVLRRADRASEWSAPLLNLAGSDLSLVHLVLDAGGGQGVFVSGPGATLYEVEISNADTGLVAIDALRLAVRSSRFADNVEGLRIQGNGGSALLLANSFENNRRNAIWAVFSTEPDEPAPAVAIQDNRLHGGINGIVAGNADVDLRGNTLSGFSGVGVMVMGGRATIAENRILGNTGIGLHVSSLSDSFITNNEIGRNTLVGMLILDAGGLKVDDNEVYDNGYGIAAVGRRPISAVLHSNTLVNQAIDGLITIGESPLILGNLVSRNRSAGIRILDLEIPGVPLIEAVPHLAKNVVFDNGNDTVQRGRYVVVKQ